MGSEAANDEFFGGPEDGRRMPPAELMAPSTASEAEIASVFGKAPARGEVRFRSRVGGSVIHVYRQSERGYEYCGAEDVRR